MAPDQAAPPRLGNKGETLADVPWIVASGGEKFASLGVEKNGGTRLIGVSGPVNRPGVYELSAGVLLREVIYTHAGGLKDGKALKAVIPGGSSTPVLRPDEIDVTFDIESMGKIGTMPGSGGVIVIAEGTCMVRALSVLMKFYAHESCGQCTPCREGTGWLAKVVGRIENGQGRGGGAQLVPARWGPMPTFLTNGVSPTVPEGTTILEAAGQIGIEIPHYCYHPKLSIAGNCRMCLVEGEKFPKLQISCNTVVTEGVG